VQPGAVRITLGPHGHYLSYLLRVQGRAVGGGNRHAHGALRLRAHCEVAAVPAYRHIGDTEHCRQLAQRVQGFPVVAEPGPQFSHPGNLGVGQRIRIPSATAGYVLADRARRKRIQQARGDLRPGEHRPAVLIPLGMHRAD